jgi:hypothetical protein
MQAAFLNWLPEDGMSVRVDTVRTVPLPELREATPERVVPAGRLGYDLRANQLLLHSFLAPDAWDELVDCGVLRARIEHALDDPIDELAYSWMARQVREQLGADGDTWPLWAWARTTRRDMVSDARRYLRLAPGTVLVTARVDRACVLLSDYGEWHSPLNAHPVVPPDATDDEFGQAIDAWYRTLDREVPDSRDRPRSMWPDHVLAELMSTWPAIFDQTRWTRRTHVQGCLAELAADDVIDAVRLVRSP